MAAHSRARGAVVKDLTNIGQSAATALGSLPWGAEAVAFGALAAGLLLWLIGRRLAKPVFVLVAGSTGAAMGFFAPLALGVAAHPYLGAGVGAVGGVVLGVALYRVSMAVSLAVGLGLGLPVGAAVVMTLSGSPMFGADAERPPLEAAEHFLADVPIESFVEDAWQWSGKGEESGEAPVVVDTGEALHAGAERVRRFLGELGVEARRAWDGLPDERRWTLLGLAAAGVVAGFFLGLARPRHVAAVATAFVGAAVWLPGAAAVLVLKELPGREFLPATATAGLATWVVVSLIGAVVQLMTIRRRADKSKD